MCSHCATLKISFIILFFYYLIKFDICYHSHKEFHIVFYVTFDYSVSPVRKFNGSSIILDIESTISDLFFVSFQLYTPLLPSGGTCIHMPINEYLHTKPFSWEYCLSQPCSALVLNSEDLASNHRKHLNSAPSPWIHIPFHKQALLGTWMAPRSVHHTGPNEYF